MTVLELAVLPGPFAVCRLSSASDVPSWATTGEFSSITRTMDELSIVCAQDNVPDDVRVERDWVGLKVMGPLDFALTGILANLATVLAEAGISIFAVSTYDTDYLLVKETDLDAAGKALTSAGHNIQTEQPS